MSEREDVFCAIGDLTDDLLHSEDGVDDIADLIEGGEITIADMVQHFRECLEEQLGCDE